MIVRRFHRHLFRPRTTRCAAAVLCRLVWGMVLTALLLHPAIPVLAHVGEPAIRTAGGDTVLSHEIEIQSGTSLDRSASRINTDESPQPVLHSDVTPLGAVLAQRSGERDLATDLRLARCLHPLSVVRPVLQWPGRAILAARAPHHVPASGSPSLVTLGMRLQP